MSSRKFHVAGITSDHEPFAFFVIATTMKKAIDKALYMVQHHGECAMLSKRNGTIKIVEFGNSGFMIVRDSVFDKWED